MMGKKLSNQFFQYYAAVFLLSLLAAGFAFLLLSFADARIADSLTKNVYTAAALMRDDPDAIDVSGVVASGGGVQIIDSAGIVLLSKGLDAIGREEPSQISAEEFGDFLMASQSKGVRYHYDVLYNEKESFWLVVSFPTSIRLDFSVVFNREAVGSDFAAAFGAILAVLVFYLLFLAFCAFVLSRITAGGITRPLRKLTEGARLLRHGDYTARVDLKLKNEFAELQDTFNAMAARIEAETAGRRQAEENRRKLILDISHDLKNPLSGIIGYAELALERENVPKEEQRQYLETIRNNARRANRLLMNLFELSKLDSPGFALQLQTADIAEYLREFCAEWIADFEKHGFSYRFAIPDGPLRARIDKTQLNRVFQNLADNALRYNPVGTEIFISLQETEKTLDIVFGDTGIGLGPEAAARVFQPFFRADAARNSATGGSGLGLSIAHKIVSAHSGELTLETGPGQGCRFLIALPKS